MSDWLKGPEFLAWLEDEFKVTPEVARAHGFERQRGEWRSGRTVSVWAADKVLTRLELHISLIPDEVWTEEKPERGNLGWSKSSEADRLEVVARLNEGESVKEVSENTGWSETAVKEWRAKAAQGRIG